MTTTMSYREAREALTESDRRGPNEAQDILEDLAHWGAEAGKAFSYLAADGRIYWLSYAGTGSGQPRYLASQVRETANPVGEGDEQP